MNNGLTDRDDGDQMSYVKYSRDEKSLVFFHRSISSTAAAIETAYQLTLSPKHEF